MGPEGMGEGGAVGGTDGASVGVPGKAVGCGVNGKVGKAEGWGVGTVDGIAVPVGINVGAKVCTATAPLGATTAKVPVQG